MAQLFHPEIPVVKNVRSSARKIHLHKHLWETTEGGNRLSQKTLWILNCPALTHFIFVMSLRSSVFKLIALGTGSLSSCVNEKRSSEFDSRRKLPYRGCHSLDSSLKFRDTVTILPGTILQLKFWSFLFACKIIFHATVHLRKVSKKCHGSKTRHKLEQGKHAGLDK